MRLLGLCGSLRAVSRSRVLLEATGQLATARAGTDWWLYPDLGALPLFNPDAELTAPPAVQDLWAAVAGADALVIASPEYAHGITGTLKNALDWLVGFPPFAGKPVAVFNPARRAHHADAQLREVLQTMNARLVPGACRCVPVTASALGARELAAASEVAVEIQATLDALLVECDRA